MTPRATVRLQLSSTFTLEAVARHVDYYASLGISHLYLSPLTRALPQSTHGYDVVDYSSIDPELGGEAALRALVRVLRERGMGIVLDIVPNHMAAHPDNAWWRSVLEAGPASPFAEWFDIDWQPAQSELHGKLLLPILGRPYAQALEHGDVQLGFDASSDSFLCEVHGMALPLARGSLQPVAPGAVESVLEAHNAQTPSARRLLHDLLECQHYRLAWWRCAGDQINWRRFFEISGLVGIRVERDDVFQAVHALPLRLYEQGLIDGLRIDHVDGMAYPLRYCERLRTALSERAAHRTAAGCDDHAWVIVEKILGDTEVLDQRWQVQGDTGYEFMDAVGALMHAGDGEAMLTRVWATISGDSRAAADVLREARRLMVERHFSAERNALLHVIYQITQRLPVWRDWTRPVLARALDELLIAFPVYRIYAVPGEAADEDLRFMDQAKAEARRRLLDGGDDLAAAALDSVVSCLSGQAVDAGEDESAGALIGVAMRRFQQLTPPLAAKAQEDTMFYRYGRLLSRNEVGSDPRRFAMREDEFHSWNRRRVQTAPLSMVATATHDHKRGEDLRARLAVLSEAPAAWRTLCRRYFDTMPDARPANAGVPRAQAYMLLQTMVGAWPLDLRPDDTEGLNNFCERLKQWQIKALREGKQSSSWFSPDQEAEAAANGLLDNILRNTKGAEIRTIIAHFVELLAPAGVVNSLASTILRCTVPGVPDLYQGCELWDFSLVDPDNRRDVDVAGRADMLVQSDAGRAFRELMADWRDGAVKQAVIAACLRLRRSRPELFACGDYEALRLSNHAGQAMAFTRRWKDDAVLVVVSRQAFAALQQSGVPGCPLIPPSFWGDAAVVLPEQATQWRWRDVLSGSSHACREGRLELAGLLAVAPVAVLVPA